MKFIKSLIILCFTVLICSCSEKGEDFERLKIWEDIQNAVKDKNVNYLLSISKDTLECLECNEGKSWILKEEFFQRHLNQIVQPHDREYSIYSEPYSKRNEYDTLYRINYSHTKPIAHNTIYTILQGKGGVQFKGVIGVP